MSLSNHNEFNANGIDKLTKNGLNDVPEELFDHREIVVGDLKDGKNESSEIIENKNSSLSEANCDVKIQNGRPN